MSLTDDLKNGVLPDGNYFCKTALGDIDVFNCVDGNLFTFADENQVYFVDEILAICDYDHFVGLTEKAKKYDRIKVNGNCPDKISRLKSRIKHLLELQANQDKELESARWYQTVQNEDIAKLRQLLRECYVEIGEYMDSDSRLIQILKGMFENDTKID